jgi:hypothetical protein
MQLLLKTLIKFLIKICPVFMPILILGCVVASLSACQGSQLGSSLEGVIAPATKSPESEPLEPIAVSSIKPNPQTTTSPTPQAIPSDRPTTQISTTNQELNLDRVMAAIAVQAIPKAPKQPSLTDYLAIKFEAIAPAVNPFNDISQAPNSLQPWLKDLNKLGTIEPKIRQEFQPNILITRREYARWLFKTNNRLYQKQPSRQIRLAQPTDNPSFADIPKSHPDFAIVQGLANAGLITGDRFRPNDLLVREELVQWKIPLDIRQPLPSANVENIEQLWGFQDSNRISDNALRSIFADGQLGDLANIRRSFGFTTILQPQKPVTRAEAAASLWYFGTAIDGISVTKALELEGLNGKN